MNGMAETRVEALARSVFDLLDSVEAQLNWMLTYAQENNLPEERFESLRHLMARTRLILQDLQELELQIANRSNGGPRDKLTPYPPGGPLRNYILQLGRRSGTT
jgi:hypothetical protein